MIQGLDDDDLEFSVEGDGYSRKNWISSDGLTYFEYVCVPLLTRPSISSANKIVRRYASGVRDIVDRKRCPPGCRLRRI